MASHNITPCLWFDGKAEEAARFYTSIFPGSEIRAITHYGKEGHETHGQPEGEVMTVEFTIEGRPFLGLNGGPQFKFNEAISFQIFCDTQAEIDLYWKELTAGGEEGPCGWLKDKFGLSWQVTPTILSKLMKDPDKAKVARVTHAFMHMKKLDIAGIEAAARG